MENHYKEKIYMMRDIFPSKINSENAVEQLSNLLKIKFGFNDNLNVKEQENRLLIEIHEEKIVATNTRDIIDYFTCDDTDDTDFGMDDFLITERKSMRITSMTIDKNKCREAIEDLKLQTSPIDTLKCNPK